MYMEVELMKKRTRILFYTALIIPCIFSRVTLCFSQHIYPDTIPSISFTKSPQVFDAGNTRQIGLGDLDGDGDLDAVFSCFNSGRVLFNDGTGFFTDSGQRLTRFGHGVDIGDLEGDGDLDAFLINANLDLTERSGMIYINDGSGHLQDSAQDLGDSGLNGLSIKLIDFDSDDDLDAHVNYSGGINTIYLNDGQGGFQQSGSTCPSGAFGDLDGDGDVDVFVVDSGEGYRTLLNDGQGAFTQHWRMLDATILYGRTALVDFDEDDDLDALVGNWDNAVSDSTRMLLNDGSGRFSLQDRKLNPGKWACFALGDLNGDGETDVFVSNFTLPNEIWLGDGAGGFIDSGLRLGGDEANGASALGDLDADGDLDLFVAYFGEGEGSNSVWFNETNTTCCECADCNRDISVDILDALWEVNCILGINPPPCSCDANQDGVDDILDVLTVVNIILGGSCP